MRFTTSQLMALVAIAAIAFWLTRYPRAVIGVAVPLAAWALIVLPVLATAELLAWRAEGRAYHRWPILVLGLILTLVVSVLTFAGAAWLLAHAA